MGKANTFIGIRESNWGTTNTEAEAAAKTHEMTEMTFLGKSYIDGKNSLEA